MDTHIFDERVVRNVKDTPGFEDAVAQAPIDNPVSPTVTVSLAQFPNDPFRLYSCALFATSRGVSLTIAL